MAQSRTRIALSPDGRRLAIVAFSEGRQQIWIRSLDSVAAEPLPGTEGGISPFWSPDSRFVGFFSPGDGTLKRIALAGGPARTICAAQVDSVPTWGRDGTILFTKFLDGIFRVPADGGAPTRVTQVDKGRRELNHYWPEFLPDGQHFLYMATALEESGLRATPSVYIASLDSPEATLLTRGHSRMTYVEPGYLLFVENGALLAQRFDTTRRQLVGEPTQIADGIAYVRAVGNGSFTASTNGVLAYQSAGSESQVVWADRRGNYHRDGLASAGLRQSSIFPQWRARGRRRGRSPNRGSRHLALRHSSGSAGPIHSRSIGRERTGVVAGWQPYPDADGSWRARESQNRFGGAESLREGHRHRSRRTDCRRPKPTRRRGLVARWPLGRLQLEIPSRQASTSGSCR